MTERTVFDFLGLYAAIFRDVSAYYPDSIAEFGRDLKRLAQLRQTRGDSVFLLDLPAIRKTLDRALADGRLVRSGLPLSRGKHYGSMIPRLFWGLWSRLFDDSGVLVVDPDPNAILFLRTLLDVGKGYEVDSSEGNKYATIKEYFQIESQLPLPSPFWDGDGDLCILGVDAITSTGGLGVAEDLFRKADPEGIKLLQSVQQAADRTAGLLGNVNTEDLRPRHGPGAVSDLRSGSYKYSFPKWSQQLEQVFPYDEFGTTGLGMLDALRSDGLPIPFEEGFSRLICVPKTAKGPRLIASEPVSGQWIQQALLRFLSERIAATSIGQSIVLNDQTVNGRRALEGSRTGKWSTLDLSSASDRVSCLLVERLFRRNPFLLECFRACRTRFLSQNLDKKLPSLIKLRKFSTMGSALTFPVQSLVFYSICVGVGRYLTGGRRPWSWLEKQVLTYGDDIIVPTGWLATVRVALTMCGLKVNDSKTFSNGFFRESCGVDAYKGYDVTPPRVIHAVDKSKPETVASTVAASNNFFTKGFWHAADWLGTTGQMPIVATVNAASGVFGLKHFSRRDPSTRKSRWNPSLHYAESLILTISAKARRRRQDTASAMLQYFTEAPEPYIDYRSGVAVAGVPVYQRTWVPTTFL